MKVSDLNICKDLWEKKKTELVLVVLLSWTNTGNITKMKDSVLNVQYKIYIQTWVTVLLGSIKLCFPCCYVSYYTLKIINKEKCWHKLNVTVFH